MIVVQAPLRVSLFGGGTDFRSFFDSEGGCVLTTTIDKYIFIMVKQRFDEKLRVAYTRTEMADSVDEVQHELIREALRLTGIERGLEIITMGDIPAGSGLGSSSAVTVGTLHALYNYQGKWVPAEDLAQQACHIEIDVLGKPIGIQDQYIAAYGGLRFIEFGPGEMVNIHKVELDPLAERDLSEQLLVFYTGVTRKAETILAEQQNNISQRLVVLRRIKEIAETAHREVCNGNIDAVGYLLDESWQLKKQLASQVSNGTINAMYEAARQAGALGGKITGAGGGGFLMLYVPLDRRQEVRAALSSLRELPVRIEPDGAKVIFNYRR
jgi:D-glycero-alpha-D-manno-heptose-7-phosphate kinase